MPSKKNYLVAHLITTGKSSFGSKAHISQGWRSCTRSDESVFTAQILIDEKIFKILQMRLLKIKLAGVKMYGMKQYSLFIEMFLY